MKLKNPRNDYPNDFHRGFFDALPSGIQWIIWISRAMIFFHWDPWKRIFPYGYGSIPIHTIFNGMNIHLPTILMFTRGTRFWPTAIFFQWSNSQWLVPWEEVQRNPRLQRSKTTGFAAGDEIDHGRGYPKMHGSQWRIPLKSRKTWMIWSYPHFKETSTCNGSYRAMEFCTISMVSVPSRCLPCQ